MVSVSGFRITTEHAIRAGKIEEFKKAVNEQIADLQQTELRTKEYLAYIAQDGSRVQFVQWYEDEQAFLDHLENGGKKLAAAFDGLSDFVRSWYYTDQVTPETRELIESYGGTEFLVFGPVFDGYRRFEEPA